MNQLEQNPSLHPEFGRRSSKSSLSSLYKYAPNTAIISAILTIILFYASLFYLTRPDADTGESWGMLFIIGLIPVIFIVIFILLLPLVVFFMRNNET